MSLDCSAWLAWGCEYSLIVLWVEFMGLDRPVTLRLISSSNLVKVCRRFGFSSLEVRNIRTKTISAFRMPVKSQTVTGCVDHRDVIGIDAMWPLFSRQYRYIDLS